MIQSSRFALDQLFTANYNHWKEILQSLIDHESRLKFPLFCSVSEKTCTHGLVNRFLFVDDHPSYAEP